MVLKLTVASFLFLFASAAAQHDHHNHEHHRVNVDVYYESLCPDSMKFFTRQLYHNLLGNLSNFVNLTLVPYGKTTVTTNEATDIDFTCHHGPAECYGNKIQACALRLINGGNPSDGLGFNKIATAFINCLMDKAKRDGDKATFPTKECAQLNQVTDVNLIENCANHTSGVQYLASYGNMTDAVMKPLKSVPLIVFNKKYNKEDSDLAQENFAKALCKYIEHDTPAECMMNSATIFGFNFFSLVVAVGLSKIFN